MAVEVLKKAIENSTILRFLAGLVTQGNSSTFSRRIATGGVEMDEVAMLRRAEPREILERLVEKNVPAIVSYLSKGKWHVAKVVLSELGAYRLSVDIQPSRKPHPVNIQMDQPVGVSLKYGYGKFIYFKTRRSSFR